MNYKMIFVFLTFCFQLNVPENIQAQEWNFIKEKDGIKIYTRKEGNATLKSFKGITDLHTQMDNCLLYTSPSPRD